MKSFFEKIRGILGTLTAIGCVILVFYFLGIGCPIKYLTGISCPGCGMTRAYMCLFRGDISGAFYYHPMFFTAPIGVVLFLLRDVIDRRWLVVVTGILVLAMLVLYIYRMRCSDGNVVGIDLRSGLAYRLFWWLGDGVVGSFF